MGYKRLWVIRGMGYEGFDCINECIKLKFQSRRSIVVSGTTTIQPEESVMSVSK